MKFRPGDPMHKGLRVGDKVVFAPVGSRRVYHASLTPGAIGVVGYDAHAPKRIRNRAVVLIRWVNGVTGYVDADDLVRLRENPRKSWKVFPKRLPAKWLQGSKGLDRKHVAVRDALIRPFKTYGRLSTSDFSFARMPVTIAAVLRRRKFLDPKNSWNMSPTNGAMIRFGKRFPPMIVTVSGRAFPPTRDGGYGVEFDGIEIDLAKLPASKRARAELEFRRFARDPDTLVRKNGRLEAWWD